jgi:hypothetical protein
MADLILVKRPAMHKGEIGLFVDSETFESEFASIKNGVGLEVKATQPRSLPQMRHAWALATKIANSGVLGEASQRETMDYLLLKARHVRYVTTQFKGGTETIPVVKSIRFAAMDQTEFQRLYNRMIHIVATEILPEMPEGELRAEVERMAGVATPEPQPKRGSRALPKPVSVIPPLEAGDTDVPPAPTSVSAAPSLAANMAAGQPPIQRRRP